MRSMGLPSALLPACFCSISHQPDHVWAAQAQGCYLSAYAQARILVDAPALLQHLAMPCPAFVGLQLSHKLSLMLGNCQYLPSLAEMSGPQVTDKNCHYSETGEKAILAQAC